MPPYLAGRTEELAEFERLLKQDVVLENCILTGLRGVGKTVLLETFKPLAQQRGWLWVGADLSESASLTEENLATRLMADLAPVTSQIAVEVGKLSEFGLSRGEKSVTRVLDYLALREVFEVTPGLPSDKLKAVLELIAGYLPAIEAKGIVFAYDEAQILQDHDAGHQFPLSLLLDVFQSLQRRGLPLMLVLTGLPTLFGKLVGARTYAERMFRVITLDRLDPKDSKDAIVKPVKQQRSPVTFTEAEVESVVRLSGGYPYFIQFICREAYDIAIQKVGRGDHQPAIPFDQIVRKLDADFFAGRWSKATDRQRDLMTLVAAVVTSAASTHGEFTVQQVVAVSKSGRLGSFGSSNVNQMLSHLCDVGLVYKNRHGRYCFAVPLFAEFINRQTAPDRP